ncbi:MAG: FlgD immunoglobulin-like domain containing protein [Candidatus Desantisbacteria bacterium]
MTMIHRLIISEICILSLAAFSFVNVAQGASYFSIVTQNANIEIAGKDFSVTLVARETGGGTDTSYAGSCPIIWSWNNAANSPDGFAPSNPNANLTFDKGIAIATGSTLPNAGTCTLSASYGTISGISTTITVNPGTATQFKFAASSTVTAGTPFFLSYLHACDWCGNVATGYSERTTLNYSGPGNGSIIGSPKYPNPVTFDQGKANLPLPLRVTLYRVEDTHIHIEAPGIVVNKDSGTITVTPGTPHHFEVTTGNNQIEQAGIQFSITIRARDAYGNLATGYDGDYPIACTWTSTSPSTKLPDGIRTFMNGTTTIPGFILTNANEMPVISVTDSMFSGISGSITVNPGTATKFKVSTEHNNIEKANRTFKVILTCQDVYKNTLTNFSDSYPIEWKWTANSMYQPPPSKPATFTHGIATIDGFTLTKADEIPIIIAKSTISGESSPITVKPGEAAILQVIAPSTVDAGQSFSLESIVAYDYCGNIATAYKGLKILQYSGPLCGPVLGTPRFTTQVYFSDGLSTTDLKTTLIRAGTCSIRIDDDDEKIQGQSGTITVKAGGATIFSLRTQNDGTEKAGVSFWINIVASDIFGNFASGYGGNPELTWTVLPNNTQARLPQDGKQFFINGSATVSDIILFNAHETPIIAASDGIIRGTSSQIVVVPTGVTHFEMSTQHNQAEVAGATFSVTLTARDGYGNVDTNYVGNKDLRWGLIATSSPTGILPAKPDDGLQIFNQGRVEVNGFRLTRARDVATITVTESTITGTCGQIMVKAGTPTTLWIVAPGSVTVDQMFEINKITVQDICGNTAQDYQGNKTITYTGPGNSPTSGTPSYTNSVLFDQGESTGKLWTTLVKAETVAIRVQEGALSGESAMIEIKPSLTSRFEIVTSHNGTETAGQLFLVTIRVLDVRDNLDPSYTGSHRIRWECDAHRSANDSLPTIAQDGTYTFTAGIAVASWFKLVNADELPTIIARDGSIEGRSKPIIVESGTPSSFAITTLPYVTAGEPFNITSIIAKDNYGNAAKSYKDDRFLNYSGPGTGSLKGTSSYTNVVNFDKGIATNVLRTTLYKAEKVRIHVEYGGIFGDSMEIEVRGAAPKVFQVITEHDNIETAGEAFSIIVKTMDEFGNEVSSYTDRHHLWWIWNATASPDGTMPDRPLHDNEIFNYGVSTIKGFNLTNATQTLSISVTDGNVRGTSSFITIKPNKAVLFDISVPSPVTVGNSFNISNIIAKDSYGNTAVSYDGKKILSYTGPNGNPEYYNYAATFTAGILITNLVIVLTKQEITAIQISDPKENVVGTSNGIEVLTMGCYFSINPHEVYANTTRIMDCKIINNNSAMINKIQIIIPGGFTFMSPPSVPQCSNKKVWKTESYGQVIDLIPQTVSDCLLNGESMQIQITVKPQEQEQKFVAWPCLITSGNFTDSAKEAKEGDSQVRITAYRLEAEAFPQVILLGGTATVIAKLAEIATIKPCVGGRIEFSIIAGNAVLLEDPNVYTNPLGSATISLKSGTSTGTVTVQVKYRQVDGTAYDIKTVNIRIVSNVPEIIPGKDGFIKQNEVIVKPRTPISLINEEGFDLKYRIDNGTWTTYIGPFSVGTEGVHTIDYACVDKSGNPGPIMSSPLFVTPASFSDVINFPNPFSPDIDGVTYIEYYLDNPMDVEIRIYNLFGEFVRNLDQPSDKAGTQRVEWDGKNGYGDVVGNGGYICVVRVKDQTKGMKRKILVVK